MLFALLVRMGGYASLALYGRSAVILLAAGLPLVFVDSWLGDRLVQRLDPQKFGRFVSGLVCLSGVGLLLK
jgi:uncharacterized membrane protein YfcA